MKAISRHPTILDDVLTMAANLIVLYIGGASLGISQISGVLMVVGLIASLLGFLFARLARRSGNAQHDGLLYTIAAVSAMVFVVPLNKILPEGGFPLQIIATAGLSWMIVLGSIFSWRDPTRMFQVVPGIAVFGLVGAFDFEPTPFFFFAYLLAVSTMFFRAHARTMLDRAERSFALDSDYARPEDRQELVERMVASGAWRWMAGTEWAIGSALIIVVISIIGAPLIQKLASPISGAAKFNSTRNKVNRFGTSNGENSSFRIGRGPASLSDTVVLHVEGPSRFWRTRSFTDYRGKGWDPGRIIGPDGRKITLPMRITESTSIALQDLFFEAYIAPKKNTMQESFRVQARFDENGRLPVPGNLVQLNPATIGARVNPEGNVSVRNRLTRNFEYTGTVTIPKSRPVSAETPPVYDPEAVYDVSRLSTRAREFAEQATIGAKSDYEKVSRLAKAIAKRTKYNLRAPAVPGDNDPVDYFLFESKEGYCDLYASSLAMLVRSLGLPSRVTVGFLVNTDKPDETGMLPLREKDRHVWTEVFFRDTGWVIFDATAGTQDITPKVERGQIKFDFSNILIYGATGLVLAGLGFIGFAQWRSNRRSGGEPRAEAGRLYEMFTEAVEKASNKPRRLHETPHEFIQRASPTMFGDQQVLGATITAKFEEVMYAADTPAEKSLTELRELIGEFRKLKAPK